MEGEHGLIGIIILSTLVTQQQQPNYDYDALLQEAYECTSAKPEHVNSGIVDKLAKIEDKYFQMYQIPDDLRGMLLAAACTESGYNSEAKGDWEIVIRRNREYKVPRAKGILQFWQWSERAYGLNRMDPIKSAHVWMQHIVKTYNKNRCRGYRLTNKQRWLAAWAQAVRGKQTKENRYRCFERTKHWKKLKKWKRMIKTYEKLKNEDPGC